MAEKESLFEYRAKRGREVVRLTYDGRAYLFRRVRVPRFLGEFVARVIIASTIKFLYGAQPSVYPWTEKAE